jgi:hypothetical protein
VPFQPPPKQDLQFLVTLRGEGRGFVVSYMCLISTSVSNAVLTSSVPIS